MPSPKSPHEMFQVMKANILEKTGRGFDEWVRLAKKSGIAVFKALTDHMKAEHDLTHGYAQMIAWGVLDPSRLEAGNQDQDMVDALYQGKKAHLRPVYEALIRRGSAIGKDVETVICKTYTSLRAKSQFAIVAPRTNSAVDLELAMPPGTPASERLEAFASSYPKFTHRIRLSEPAQVDTEVMAALEAAFAHNRAPA